MTQPNNDQQTALPEAQSADIAAMIQEIEAVMSAYIPEFERKFSTNFIDAAVTEIRKERSFEIKTARALVFGETGVGKTTTINYLLNSPIFPTSGELSCTKSLACGEHEGGLIFYDSPGLGDEEGLENVTRVTLGIDQLDDAPIDQITLIDITRNNAEGPDDYTTLPYSAFSDEISANFYEQHQARIVGKQFELTAFEAWAATHFDFMVFVTSSQRGLPKPIARILQAFDQKSSAQKNGDTLQLFKVFNIFGDQYQPEADDLPPAVQKRYQQTQERSRSVDLTDAEQWFLIDSQTGQGLEPLIRAFADKLPVEVLARLTQVVKQEYTHLIEARIVSYFFDYVAHIAALVGVFPVDQTRHGQDFLAYIIQSMAIMGQFMFGRQNAPLSAETIDNLIQELVTDLRSAKQRTTYTTTVQREKKRNPLLKLVDSLGKNIKPDFDAYESLNGYTEREEKVPEKTTYSVGGVDGIRLTLALGLSLHQLYHLAAAENPGAANLDTTLELNWRGVEANMGYRTRSQLIQLLRTAQKTTQPEARREMAEALYPHIRPLLEAGD